MNYLEHSAESVCGGHFHAILNNTTDGVPVTVRLSFAGGMAIDLPNGMKAAFNHDALGSLLQ